MNPNLYVPVILFSILLSLVAILYLKNVFLWRRDFFRDLENLEKNRANFDPSARRAMGLVIEHCRDVLGGRFDSREFILDLPRRIMAVAGAFRPESEHPELETTPSRIMVSLNNSMPRYDRILRRPGFSSLSRMTFRDARDAAAFWKRQEASRGWIHGFRHLRSLVLLRYLAADLSLYAGCLAVDAYSPGPEGLSVTEEGDIRETLEEISSLDPDEPAVYPGEIQRLRNSLAGMPGILVKDPTPAALLDALHGAALFISGHLFPDSGEPLLEARIGYAVSCGRSILVSIGNNNRYPVKGRILSLRLSTLLKAKRLSRAIFPKTLRDRLGNLLETYGWLKWPLRVYLVAGNGMFWRFAAEAGWFAGRKTLLALFFGRCFDSAVKEIENLYRLSGSK
jgi:hypothetical protein